MHWAEILFYVLITVIGTGFIWTIGSGKIQLPTNYRITLKVLHPGCNVHKQIKIRDLPHDVEIKIGEDEKKFTIKVEDLWKVKVIFYKRIFYFLTGVKGPFLCIFRSSDESEAVKPSDILATPGLIRKVKKSRILTKALREIFKGGVGGAGRFIIILGATLLIVFLAYQYGLIG